MTLSPEEEKIIDEEIRKALATTRQTNRSVNPNISTLAIIMLGISVLPFSLPYGFYTILRFIVCFYFIAKLFLLLPKNNKFSFKFFISCLFAIIFNPFIRISFEKSQWWYVDILALFCVIYFERKSIILWLKRR